MAANDDLAPLVVDASVVMKWFVPEPFSAEALVLRTRRLFAPDLIIAEVCNALWNKVQLGQLTASQAHARALLLRHVPLGFEASADLGSEALRHALRFRHPVYDCLYLALALRRECKLVTADRRFFDSVQSDRRLSGCVALLGESPLT